MFHPILIRLSFQIFWIVNKCARVLFSQKKKKNSYFENPTFGLHVLDGLNMNANFYANQM